MKGIDLLKIQLRTAIIEFITGYFSKTGEEHISLDITYGNETITGLSADFNEDGTCKSVEIESTYIDNTDGLVYYDHWELAKYDALSELCAIYDELKDRIPE